MKRRARPRPDSGGEDVARRGWASAEAPDQEGDAIVPLADIDITRVELDRVCLDQALRFLAQRPRSTSEVRRRLGERAHPEDRIERVLERLHALRLLDDVEFANYWLDNRAQFRPKGPRALRSELFAKGIDRAIVDEALGDRGDVDEDAYRAATRARGLNGLDDNAFRTRLGQFLARRGFDWESIGRVATRMLAERDAARCDIT